MSNDLPTLSGFGNYHQTEALAGTLPQGQNSPQQVAHGLYAEQLSGSAFTAPKETNFKSWQYRIRPSVIHGPFEPYHHPCYSVAKPSIPTSPEQYRFAPLPFDGNSHDFVDGLVTYAHNGSAESQTGCDVLMYACNRSMQGRFFYNADGDFLIVPQEGRIECATEFGYLHVSPGEIVVIPRGIRFQINCLDDKARGYIAENYGEHFTLPGRGPIGANGLANERDFHAPVARYHDKEDNYEIIHKFQGHLWRTHCQHHPLDVVAWHGNYYPYKYDLSLFNTINTVSFDHPDPSIFTVLTSPSAIPGTANCDFVIFPPRWMVAENTFRPPYYHRNLMSEFMGLIKGEYDAKQGGFVPGGASIHNCYSAHGPDGSTFEKAIKEELVPKRYRNTLAFMFECRGVFHPSEWLLRSNLLDEDYATCWQSLQKHFTG